MVTFNLIGLVGFVALTITVLFLVKLIAQPAKDVVAKMLIIALVACLFTLLLNHLYRMPGFVMRWPHYSFTTIFLMFSIGPLLYTYTRRLAMHAGPGSERYWFLHWLLPLGLQLCFSPYYMLSASEKIQIISSHGKMIGTSLYLLNYLQIFIYIFLSLRVIRYCQKGMVNKSIKLSASNLAWLRLMCFGLLAVMLADQVIPMTGVNTDIFYQFMLVIVSIYNLVLCYSALGFSQIDFSVNDTHRLTDDHCVEVNQKNSANLSFDRKYERSSLRMDSAAYYGDKLIRLMEEEQYYLDNSVSLRTLAEKIKVSGHHLSQILNEQFHKNFYDFINEQRVEFAKRLLLRDKNVAVLDIAFESGFNNKVTFYNAFKRYVGMTPTEYRKSSALTPALKM